MLDIVKLDRVKNIVILGDFNADNNTRDGDKFNVFTGINNLTSLIDEPTRITAISQTRLDRILTNIPTPLGFEIRNFGALITKRPLHH